MGDVVHLLNSRRPRPAREMFALPSPTAIGERNKLSPSAAARLKKPRSRVSELVSCTQRVFSLRRRKMNRFTKEYLERMPREE